MTDPHFSSSAESAEVNSDSWLESLKNWERRDAAKRGWETRRQKEKSQ